LVNKFLVLFAVILQKDFILVFDALFEVIMLHFKFAIGIIMFG